MRIHLILLGALTVFHAPARKVIEHMYQNVYDGQSNITATLAKRFDHSPNNVVLGGYTGNSFLSHSPFTQLKLNQTFANAIKPATASYVNKVKLASATPVIFASVASGTISACVGLSSTNVQQFTVSGNDLSDNITVTAPAGFEVSFSAGSGFANSLTLVPAGSLVNSTIVYVRSTTAITSGNLSGFVTLATTGAASEKVAVAGVIYPLPTVDQISDLTFTNGELTTPINFTGTGNTFYWTNDRPGIGLAASGGNNIAPFTAVNIGSAPVVAQISVTSQQANIAYIPDYNSATVFALNTITNKIMAAIPVGPNPGFVAISPDGKKAYVANVQGLSLSVINTQTNQVVKDIPIFDTPTSLIFSRDGTRAYVAGASGECTVIDVANDAVLTALTLPSSGAGLALSNDGKLIYATSFYTGDVRVYDADSHFELINIPAPGAHYAVTSPDGEKIYFTGSYSNSVYVIDVASNTLSETISLTADAEGIAISPDGNHIFVTNPSVGSVTVINTTDNSILVTLPVGQSPQGISITPDGKYVYVINANSGTYSVINTSDFSVAAEVPSGISPYVAGNFITPYINNCTGPPTDFKITVNPSPTTITPGTASGLITTCIGTPSASFQQFTVSGNNLSGNIIATSPAGLEISFNQTSGFADVLTITPNAGAVTDKVIYVRAKASGTPANIADFVVLSTAGAASKNVAVKGVINALPTTDAIVDPVYKNGDVTVPLSFTGTGNTYIWTNDKPAIGLGASGTGDIPSFTAQNTGAAPVVANITVTPLSAGYLYLGSNGGVVMVNADNNKQSGSINTGGQPTGIAVSPDGTLVAITDFTANTVKFINTNTHKVVSTVSNVLSPLGICFTPDGKKVYVANENTFNVTVIDVATAKAEAPFHVGVYPYGIAASPDGLTVYVGCTGENAIIAIDTKTHQTTQIKVNFGPTGIAVSPDNSRVYATSAQYHGLLKVVNTATKLVIANIPIGDVSTGICVSPDGKRVYISNTQSNNVMVIDAEINSVIKTIPVGNRPFGVSITPDGKYVYVANQGTNNVNIISTADNSISNIINITGQLSTSLGNFFAPGTGCSGTPVNFTITVNGPPAITTSAVTGTISACMFSASVNTQQFTVNGVNLTSDAQITVPANFEVSLSQSSGFANSVIIAQTGGAVTGQVVYVRAAASGNAGTISGNAVLSYAGLPDNKIAVNGVIHALPTVNQLSDQSFNHGEASSAISFTGTATTFTWTNDTPGIGLPSSGSGTIPAFTAVNNLTTPITATITVVPSDVSCTGSSISFKININPAIPSFSVSPLTGSITTCLGSPSVSPNIQQFTVNGVNLTSDAQITAPANFEVSLSQSSGFANSVIIAQTGGAVTGQVVYVRAAASGNAGTISGNAVLSYAGLPDNKIAVNGVIHAMPTVNQLSDQSFNHGEASSAISFTGTATTFTWTNDTPGIGLPSSGSGTIPAFTAVNNLTTPITATITVVPSDVSCTGSSISFKININPAIPSFSVSPLTGSITTCLGSPSVSPNIQQFTVNGVNLTSDAQITVPANFEVSLSQSSGFANSVIIAQTGGAVTGQVVYVRAAASGNAGTISGNAVLSYAGLPDNKIAVNGVIHALPTVNQLSDQSFNHGEASSAISFTGTATTFTWTNDTPGIGLPSSGSGTIPAFTAVNNLTTPITATITVVPSDVSCTGSSISFKININPAIPSFSVSPLTGSIATCLGSPSVSPNIQQFTVNGVNLTSDAQITAPANFEVSLSQSSGFANSVIIAQTGGAVTGQVVYVRAAASGNAGTISGNAVLSYAGLPDNKIAVNGVIHAMPTVNQLSDQSFNHGEASSAISFTGTATTFTWTNDTPGIGLPSSGSGTIPAFTAVNNLTTPITATITVVPSNGSCTGSSISFKININPAIPSFSVSPLTGSITTCLGSPSVSPNIQQFTVNGVNLTSDAQITVPANFEVSLSQSSGFANSVIIAQTGGAVTGQVVYVRAAASGNAGTISGNAVLSYAGLPDNKIAVNGVIHALPTVNQLSDQSFNHGEASSAISFTGTATTFTWTNDTPGIGLPSSGSGTIPAFTAVNNLTTPITATITVVPSDVSCTGSSISFKININPAIPSFSVSPLTGSITTCLGSPSVSPNIQQFTVNGVNLTSDAQITVPANFEVSLSQSSGFANSVIIAQTGGAVTGQVVYVRAAASGNAGTISGNAVLSYAGLPDNKIAVNGVIHALPTVNQLSDQSFNHGEASSAISFTGTATTFTWTNDTPGIGLPSGGSGTIPAFTAVNNLTTPITATITVVPSDVSCTGSSISFKININPAIPSFSVNPLTGSIATCLGSPSVSPNIQQFTVNGVNLTSDAQMTAPANFEVSLSQSSGFANSVIIAQTGGAVTGQVVYVRAAASGNAGTISGNAVLSYAGLPDNKIAVNGVIHALPTVNQLSDQSFNHGEASSAISFTGTATTFTWTNDTPGIGLPSGGSGTIPAFTAVNNLTTPITATITVVPSNGSCTGSFVFFKLTIKPAPIPVIALVNNLSPLSTGYGKASASGSFSVSGDNLVSGIVITPPPGFEVSTDGINFQNTATIGSSGTLAATTVYIRLTKTTSAGDYGGNIILKSGGMVNNLFMPNSTVIPAMLIITADNKTRTVHSENPPFTITYNGFVNIENELNLVKKPTVGTTAILTSAVGEYPISFISGAESPNYNFTYVPGTLTLTSAGVVVVNTFTPNGDGRNDKWGIRYIENYPNCTVNVFNRWGAEIFSSIGYGEQWDGRSHGSPVPAGTYYYVINLRDGSPVKSGWVAIIR